LCSLSKAVASALPALIATPDGLVNAAEVDEAAFDAETLELAFDAEAEAATEAFEEETATDAFDADATADDLAAEDAAGTLLDLTADEGVIDLATLEVVVGLIVDVTAAAEDDFAATLDALAALEAAADDFADDACACGTAFDPRGDTTIKASRKIETLMEGIVTSSLYLWWWLGC